MKRTVTLILILVLTVFLPGTRASDDRAVPPSVRLGLHSLPAGTGVLLPAVDTDQLLREDRSNGRLGVPYRIGVHRDLPVIYLEDGEMSADARYGLIWRMRIESEGAFQLRLHIQDADLPDGSRLFVYSEEGTADYYQGAGPFDSGDFWTWATDGDYAVVEWVAPGVDAESLTELPFRITETAHAYRDLYGAIQLDEGREQGCHNDATCDMVYREQRDASAKIGFNDSGWYICSGTMINSSAGNFTPYFITANHCISTNPVAQTIQVYFFFHTAVCNSGSASQGTARNGSNMLATTNGSDCTLLQLTSTGFSGIFFSGWDRNTVALNEAVTSVHHPDGAYKRISYGSRINYFGYQNFWDTRWNRTANPGATEGGSSGGGLFRDSNRLFIGQLYGGTSACDNQDGPDTYGKFSVSFTAAGLGTWLGTSQTLSGAYYGGSVPTATPAQATATPVPSQTPQPTYTQIPTWTPSNRTATPTPQWSPTPGNTPEPTPTPPCSELGTSLSMPATMFAPGDVCGCTVTLCNPGASTLDTIHLYVALEVAGSYFLAPSFDGYDYYDIDLTPGYSMVTVIPEFSWPAGAGSFYPANWYAGMVDPDTFDILGNLADFSFGWTE